MIGITSMASNITIEERIKIKALHDQGYGVPDIAKYLKRHKTSIYRELSKRNESGVYDHQYAQKLTSANMVRQGHQKPTEETIMLIEMKIINEQWSSEQISVLRNFYSCFWGAVHFNSLLLLFFASLGYYCIKNSRED